MNEGIELHKYKRLRKVWNFNETHFNIQIYPVSNVVISISSSEAFAIILEDLRNSLWWNHNARFLIINQDLETSCQQAGDFLKTVWNFNVLSALYVCRYLNQTLALYSFNPFSNIAPKFWEKAMVDCSLRNCWTLLQHLLFKSSGSLIEQRKYYNIQQH